MVVAMAMATASDVMNIRRVAKITTEPPITYSNHDPENRRSAVSQFALNIQFLSNFAHDHEHEFFSRKLGVKDKYAPTKVPLCDVDSGETTGEHTLTGDILIQIVEYCLPKNDTTSPLGKARICAEHATTDRPLSAVIAICPQNNHRIDKILVHEIFHALGFNRRSFEKRALLDSTYRKGGRTWHFTGKFASAYVQHYFNCESARVELSVTRDHLSDRLFHGLLMRTEYDERDEHESALVLAIMADLGWYIRQAKGKDGIFGHRHCEFVHMDCQDYYKYTGNEDFYCFRPFDGCDIRKYVAGTIPLSFLRFPVIGGDEYYGGPAVAEFCPINDNYRTSSVKKVPPAIAKAPNIMDTSAVKNAISLIKFVYKFAPKRRFF